MDNSPPPEAATHPEFDALPQDEKIKWLVMQFCLDAAPVLQKDPRLRKEVIPTLLQFSNVISIGGYGKTNLISHPINVYPGTTPIKMKQRPLNPVMEESLHQQIDWWLKDGRRSRLAMVFPSCPRSQEEQPRGSLGHRLRETQRRHKEGCLPTSQHRWTICLALLVAAFSPLSMELEPSMPSLSSAPIKRKRRSLLRLGNTSLFGCPLVWLAPPPLIPDLSPRRCATYHPQKSFVTWTTRPSLPGCLGPPARSP